MAVLDPNEIMFTAFEPKVANRFIMYIDGIPAYLIKSATAPGFEAGEIILDHINVYRKIKGRAKWNDFELTLHDPITPSGTQTIMEWVQLTMDFIQFVMSLPARLAQLIQNCFNALMGSVQQFVGDVYDGIKQGIESGLANTSVPLNATTGSYTQQPPTVKPK